MNTGSFIYQRSRKGEGEKPVSHTLPAGWTRPSGSTGGLAGKLEGPQGKQVLFTCLFGCSLVDRSTPTQRKWLSIWAKRAQKVSLPFLLLLFLNVLVHMFTSFHTYTIVEHIKARCLRVCYPCWGLLLLFFILQLKNLSDLPGEPRYEILYTHTRACLV